MPPLPVETQELVDLLQELADELDDIAYDAEEEGHPASQTTAENLAITIEDLASGVEDGADPAAAISKTVALLAAQADRFITEYLDDWPDRLTNATPD